MSALTRRVGGLLGRSRSGHGEPAPTPTRADLIARDGAAKAETAASLEPLLRQDEALTTKREGQTAQLERTRAELAEVGFKIAAIKTGLSALRRTIRHQLLAMQPAALTQLRAELRELRARTGRLPFMPDPESLKCHVAYLIAADAELERLALEVADDAELERRLDDLRRNVPPLEAHHA